MLPQLILIPILRGMYVLSTENEASFPKLMGRGKLGLEFTAEQLNSKHMHGTL